MAIRTFQGAQLTGKNFTPSSPSYGLDALAIKPDGTKMYILSSGSTGVIYQYSLSTPWDVSTATYDSKSLSTTGQSSLTAGIAFSSDGTKAYVLDFTTSELLVYALSIAWDVSTGSYSTASTVLSTAMGGTSSNFYFKPDGTALFVGNSSIIKQFSLSSAWDVSTISDTSKTVSVPYYYGAICISQDGKQLVGLTNPSDSRFSSFTLSTAWDVSSASADINLDRPSVGNPLNIVTKVDSSSFFLPNPTTGAIEEYAPNIDYLTYASTPTDGATATNTANPTAVTPPTNLIAGDLVLMVGQERSASATLTVSETGGQTWTAETAASYTNQTSRLFWCVFNGTWSANPSVSFGGTTCNSVQMFAFRPLYTSATWAVNQAISTYQLAATATQTITGQTTTGDAPTVTVAGWFTDDDNTWSGVSGTGWSSMSSQFRNTSGSDQSASYGYIPQVSAGATGDVSNTQITLGNDTAAAWIITFSATSNEIVEYPANGSLALTGQAPTVSIQTFPARVTQVAVEVLTKTPSTARVTQVAIEVLEQVGYFPPNGSLAITGEAPTLEVTVPKVFAPAQDDLVITGQAPTVGISYRFTPAQDDIIVTGQTPVSITAHKALPANGSLTIAGQAPEALSVRTAQPLVGAITITGQAPSVFIAHKAVPAQDDLVISGQTPVASQDIKVLPTTGGVAITGQAPEILADRIVTPAQDDLVISGQAPTTVVRMLVLPANATLTATGQAPSTRATEAILEGFRWRNDDGTEVTATWRQVQDTNETAEVDEVVRLRVVIDGKDDLPSRDFELQYRKVGDTDWSKVK